MVTLHESEPMRLVRDAKFMLNRYQARARLLQERYHHSTDPKRQERYQQKMQGLQRKIRKYRKQLNE